MTAPDMTALVAAYANPTRAFDASAAVDVELLVERKVSALLDLDALVTRFEDTLDALKQDDTSSFTGGGTLPVTLDGDGYARIERICSGHGVPTPPVDDANGHLELTVGFSDGGLKSVVYGGAHACKEQIGSTRMTIGGDVNLYIGDNLRIDQLRAGPVLFQLADFSFSVNDKELISGGFDFQVCRGTNVPCMSGNIETLLTLPSGGTLVFFFDSATKSGGFRGSNGNWRCTFSESRCTNDAGATVTTPRIDL